MSKIAGELNAEMSKTIGSKEYNEWLNSPLTKALKRSFEQSITDPENQPSQYGTVTLAMYEHLKEQITSSQQRVSELEKERDELIEVKAAENASWNAGFNVQADQIDKLTAERDKTHQYWQIAEGRCDALKQQRDNLLAALENCRLLAARHRKEEWATHILRFCVESGVIGSPIRDSDLASVKEKQNASD